MKLLNKLTGTLLFLVFCSWSTNVSAQCAIDSSITQSGIFPDTLVGTCVGIPYEETINIIIPPDTTAMGLSAVIDSVVLDSVGGLPPGLNFFCLNGSCAIQGGTRSCVLLTGTPTTAGTYRVDLYTTSYIKIFGAPVIQTDTLVGFYNLTINPALTTQISFTGAACGVNDGTATVTPSGTAPYTYLWSNGVMAATATGLAAGIYTVETTDVNGCSVMDTVQIPNLGNVPSLAVDDAGWVGCSETGGGAINLTTTGGTAAYSYAWSSGQTTEDVTGLPEGNYSVVVTDANNCTDTRNFQIVQPSVLETAIVSQTDLACFGDNSGAINASATGGAMPYDLSWDTNPASSGLSVGNLAGGTYTLTVTDDLGCIKTVSATLTEPTELTVTVLDTSETAAGAMNGSATATASGGTPPYAYSWDFGADTSRVDTLAAGSYVLTVTDANNCTVMETVEIRQWATGLEDELAAGITEFSVFPNPNAGVFSLNLSLENYESIRVSVFDLRGNKVYTEQSSPVLNLEKVIDLSDQASGMYIIQIQGARGIATRKFMIE